MESHPKDKRIDLGAAKVIIRRKLVEWEDTKSISVASEICEMLSKNIRLLS